MKIMKSNSKFFLSVAAFLLVGLLYSCKNNSYEEAVWPPDLPTANENGVASLNNVDMLKVSSSVQHVLDSTSNVKLKVAGTVPVIDLVYHSQLPTNPNDSSGALWSSWGDICLASDGKVYSGTGNHWGIDRGETYIYSWDPSTKELKKIADINKITGAQPGEVHFSKVHAPIIEGRDKKIYFTGTLDNGDKAGISPILERWNPKIAGGKLFQYDPVSDKTVIFADFPPARVTATTIYDAKRNVLYCELEGSPDGVSFGAFDMDKKEWIYQSEPGMVSHHRNLMLDNNGNVYFNGPREKATAKKEHPSKNQLEKNKGNKEAISMLPVSEAKRAIPESDTPIWKYDPATNSIAPTQSYTIGGFRSSTRESKTGWIYGTTMNGELFKYKPAKDELIILGSNFLSKGEYITVCDLSPDEKYVYYLPGAHGSAGFSGTPIIQYNIEKDQQKALAFLSETMTKTFNYSPGGTYGMKISNDGSTLYVGLNGSPSDSLLALPKGIRKESGFGLTSFASIYIPAQERSEN